MTAAGGDRPSDGATPPPGDRGSSGTGILASSRDPDDVRWRLQRWLRRIAPGVTIEGLAAPEGNGASSDTVLVTVNDTGRSDTDPSDTDPSDTDPSDRDPSDTGPSGTFGDGALPRRWAVRIAPDPAGMPQFPRYDMALQADLMTLVGHRSTAPVPRVLWVEPDPTVLSAGFLVMEAVEGRVPPDVMPYPFGSWLSEAPAEDQRRLQDRAVETLATIHTVELSAHERDRLGADRPGDTAMRRHLAGTMDYYRWVSADGIRSPLLERALAWLEHHCPDDDTDQLSWGDSRIGNMLFDGFEPAAVLDWEMAGTGPPEIDLGWMIFCHWWFQDMAVAFGLPGMPTFLIPDEAAACYERASGRAPRHLEYHLVYAALRLGIVMSRMARRQAAIGELEMPDDPDDTIMHRSAIEQMLAGSYWPRPTA